MPKDRVPSFWIRWCLVLARLSVACVGASCDEGDSEEIGISLRSGVRLVHDFGQYKFGGAAGSYSVPGMGLMDVARDGDHVLVTLLFAFGSIATYHPNIDPTLPSDIGSAGGGGWYNFIESRNGGEDWQDVDFSGIENNPQFANTYVKGVHLWGDLAVLVGLQRIEHPMGTEEIYPGAEVNLVSQSWVPNPGFPIRRWTPSRFSTCRGRTSPGWKRFGRFRIMPVL